MVNGRGWANQSRRRWLRAAPGVGQAICWRFHGDTDKVSTPISRNFDGFVCTVDA
jgi:hypothetical protein